MRGTPTTFISRALTTDSHLATLRLLGNARLSKLTSKAHRLTVIYYERIPHHLVLSTERAILTSVLDLHALLTAMTFNQTWNAACHGQPVVIALDPISFTRKDAKGTRLSRDPRTQRLLTTPA